MAEKEIFKTSEIDENLIDKSQEVAGESSPAF